MKYISKMGYSGHNMNKLVALVRNHDFITLSSELYEMC